MAGLALIDVYPPGSEVLAAWQSRLADGALLISMLAPGLNPDLELGDDSRSQLGYQFGLRFQPTPMLGVDAQWRHMSTSTAAGQSGRFERNQVLLGITLF